MAIKNINAEKIDSSTATVDNVPDALLGFKAGEPVKSSFPAVMDPLFEAERVDFDTDYFELAVGGAITLTPLALNRSFSDLTDYPTDASGVLTNDGVGNLSWGAGGGTSVEYEDDIESLRKLNSTVKAKTMFFNVGRSTSETFMVDGRLYLMPINVKKTESITSIGYMLISGTYTGDNENRVGLYQASADGNTLTLVASSASNDNHWNSGNGWKERALSAGHTVDPTRAYYVGLLWNASATTTAPKMASIDYSLLFSYFDAMLPANRSWARYIASTTMSASITMASTTRSIELLFTTLH